MTEPAPEFLEVANSAGEKLNIAYMSSPALLGEDAGIVWFPGLNSTMTSTKVTELARWCKHTNRSLLRFDYSGHGQSQGKFTDGTITQWLNESLAMLREVATGPQILIGSSMGAWLVLRILHGLANDEPFVEGICGVDGAVLIAPAWDMTETLIWDQLTKDAREQLESTGYCERATRYQEEPYIISKALIEDGRSHLLAGKTFKPPCPIRIIHGIEDPDVPWLHANKLTKMLTGENVMLNLVQDGDHRLSRPKDLDKMLYIIDDLYRSIAESRHFLL